MSSARSDAGSHTIALAGECALPVIVRRYARARGYRLRYDAARQELRLSMPLRGGVRPALDWVRSQQDWIARQIEAAPGITRLVPGARLPIEGCERDIVWRRDFARMPVLTEQAVHVGGQEESVGPRLVRWLRRRALETLRVETFDCAARGGLSVASVAVGDPRGRWGSCSSSGAIRYSWRLILAPDYVRRSTVAHEVAHLLHMDHSPDFHAAHARLLGENPRAARDWLRAHGGGLHRFTA